MARGRALDGLVLGALLGPPAHGYDVACRLQDHLGGLHEGVVYAALHRLEYDPAPTCEQAPFGIAGVGLTRSALAQAPAGSSAGVGASLSAGVVALVVAAWFLWSLARVPAIQPARPFLTAAG